MTVVASTAALVGVEVDPLALFRADPDSVAFVATVVDDVMTMKLRAAHS